MQTHNRLMETLGLVHSASSVPSVLLDRVNRFSLLLCLQQTSALISNRRFHQSKKQGRNDRLRGRKSPAQVLTTPPTDQNLPRIIRKPRIMQVGTAKHRISLQLLRRHHVENHAKRVHQRLLHRASPEQIHPIARARPEQAIPARAGNPQLALRVNSFLKPRYREQRKRSLNAQQRRRASKQTHLRFVIDQQLVAQQKAQRLVALRQTSKDFAVALLALRVNPDESLHKTSCSRAERAAPLAADTLLRADRSTDRIFRAIATLHAIRSLFLPSNGGLGSSICAHCLENSATMEGSSLDASWPWNGHRRTVPSVARSRFREYFSTSQG